MPPVFLEEFNVWGLPHKNEYKTKTPLLNTKPIEDVDYSYYFLTYVELI